MKFSIEIDLNNGAMEHAAHVAEALDDVADQIIRVYFKVGSTGPIQSTKGDMVGKWEVAKPLTFAERLLAAFPWLGEDGERQVSGADTIDQLQHLYAETRDL